MVLLVEGARGPRAAFGLGLAFGMGHFAVGLYWVGTAFATAGILPWAAPFAVAALAALCALFPAAACAAYRLIAPRGAWRAAAFASVWTLGEWLRGTLILGGFPWNLAGYVWTPWPEAIQSAAVMGAYGLSWLTAFAAAALAAPFGCRRSWRAPAAAAVLLAANWAAGAAVLARAPEPGAGAGAHVRIVQPNIAQERKWREDFIAERIRRHAALSTAPAAAPLAAAVWPETASPYDLARAFPGRAEIVAAVPPGGALIAGALRREAAPRRVWNSLQALDESGRVAAAYDKFHLVPFGEYSPLRGVFAAAGATGAADFARGPGPRTLRVPGPPPFAALICFEAIFPGAVVDPADRPDWLLNVTNDAWYGVSPGPFQHFEQARLRAVEEGLPLARAANTGVSGVVDAYGRVSARLGLGEAGVVDAALPPPRPPTVFSRLGNAPALAFALAALAPFAVRRLRRRGAAG